MDWKGESVFAYRADVPSWRRVEWPLSQHCVSHGRPDIPKDAVNIGLFYRGQIHQGGAKRVKKCHKGANLVLSQILDKIGNFSEFQFCSDFLPPTGATFLL